MHWIKSITVKYKTVPVEASTGPEDTRSFRLPDFEINGTCRWLVFQPYAPAIITPKEIFLVFISV
jgi:hypothetical protein